MQDDSVMIDDSNIENEPLRLYSIIYTRSKLSSEVLVESNTLHFSPVHPSETLKSSLKSSEKISEKMVRIETPAQRFEMSKALEEIRKKTPMSKFALKRVPFKDLMATSTPN